MTSTSTATQPDNSGDEMRPFMAGMTSASSFMAAASAQSKTTPSSESIEFPEFRNYVGTMAHAALTAARHNAASVSGAELESLLQERQQLLSKKLDGSINRSESIRLEYVRWSLDRIEDARHGSALDRLEDRISKYEHFLSELEDFKERLNRARRNRK